MLDRSINGLVISLNRMPEIEQVRSATTGFNTRDNSDFALRVEKPDASSSNVVHLKSALREIWANPNLLAK